MKPETQRIWSMSMIIDSVTEDLKKGSEVLISGCGTSMEPLIDPETDKLLLQAIPKDHKVKEGEIYLYRRVGGGYAIHRVWRVKRDQVFMLGDGQLLIEKGIRREWLLARAVKLIKPSEEVELLSKTNVKNAVRRNRRRMTRHRLKCIKHYVYSLTVGRFRSRDK